MMRVSERKPVRTHRKPNHFPAELAADPQSSVQLSRPTPVSVQVTLQFVYGRIKDLASGWDEGKARASLRVPGNVTKIELSGTEGPSGVVSFYVPRSEDNGENPFHSGLLDFSSRGKLGEAFRSGEGFCLTIRDKGSSTLLNLFDPAGRIAAEMTLTGLHNGQREWGKIFDAINDARLKAGQSPDTVIVVRDTGLESVRL